MTLFVFFVALVAAALVVGSLVVRAWAAIPLDILTRADAGGRFVGLRSQDESSPTAGRPVDSLIPASGFGY